MIPLVGLLAIALFVVSTIIVSLFLMAGVGDLVGGLGGGTSLIGGGGLQRTVSPMFDDSVVDCISRESGEVAAVDTWTTLQYWGGATLGNFDVPAQAKFLRGIIIQSGFDFGTSALGVRALTAVRMSGNGLEKGGLYRFLGHGGFATIDTAGGGGSMIHTKKYKCNIPVVGGNSIKVEGIMLGEDMGDVTIMVTLVFGTRGVPGGFVDGDIREYDIAAIDTPTNLTNIGAAASGNFDVPAQATKLGAVVCIIAPDFGTSVVGVCAIGGFNLKGNGLKKGGEYSFPAPAACLSAVTEDGGIAAWPGETHDVDISVQGGNKISGECTLVGTDPGDVTAALGLLYV